MAISTPEKIPFPYLGEGRNDADIQSDPSAHNGEIVLFKDGDQVIVSTEGHGVRFLLVSRRHPLVSLLPGMGPWL